MDGGRRGQGAERKREGGRERGRKGRKKKRRREGRRDMFIDKADTTTQTII